MPKGTVRTATFSSSKVFPGTTREFQVYVPAQYEPANKPLPDPIPLKIQFPIN